MKDRYRIIEFRDDNGETFYTVQVQLTWIFGLKFWRTLTTTNNAGEYSRPKMFETLEEAQKFIKRSKWTSRIIEEGSV